MTGITDRSSERLLVDVRRLTHVYRTPNEELVALRDLNLHLTEAERVAIVGPSGCGKTTLLNILAGLEIPREGAVRVAGRDLATMSEPERDEYRRRLVGYAWQRVELGWWPKLTVTENVQLPMLSVVKSGRRRRHRARALLQGVGLGQRLTRVPAELSYGEKRRLALAIALANRPMLLLADEVTAGFDDEAADGLLADLNVLLRELGTSAIIVAHGRHLPRHVDRILPLPYPRSVAMLARARRAGQVDQSHRQDGPQAVRRDVLVADSVSRSRPSPEGPVEVVRAVSLRVKTNEMVAVLGGSGAGKSTLLALCAGLDEPDAGTVTIAGQKVTGLRGAARGALLQHAVGWIMHTRPPVEATPTESLTLAARISRESVNEASRLARAALAAVGLEDRASAPIGNLSSGEQVRVAVARALVRFPTLIVADEPTAQLDILTSTDIIGLLRKAAESGVAVLLATQYEVLAEVAHRVLLMTHGTLRELRR